MDNDEQIRAEAASQAIEKTIQMVEEALGGTFPRENSPTDSRDIMIDILRSTRQKKRSERGVPDRGSLRERIKDLSKR